MINNKLQFTFICKIDFTYYLCNTVIFPSNVFIKSKKTKNSFQASIFIFKLGGVCNGSVTFCLVQVRLVHFRLVHVRLVQVRLDNILPRQHFA